MPEETEGTEAVETEETSTTETDKDAIPAEVQAQANVEAQVNAQTQETPAEEQPQWDKDRAFADEKRADAKKLEEAAHARGKLETELQHAKAALETATADDDVDPVLGEDSEYKVLIERVNKLSQDASDNDARFVKAAAETAQARALVEQLQNTQTQQTRESQGTVLLNTMMDKYDGEYGAKHRNAVYAKVTEAYADVDSDTMSDKAKASWIEKAIQLEYILQSAADVKTSTSEATPAPDIVLDPGGGGQQPSNTKKLGTLNEVSALMNRGE